MEGNEHVVDMENWQVVEAPDWLSTMGVATCTGVAFLNKTCGVAGLLHASNLSHTTDILDDFLDEILNHISSDDDIEIYLCGGDATDPSNRDAVLADRDHVEKRVRETLPCSQSITRHWLDEGGGVEIWIDTVPPKIHIKDHCCPVN